MDLHSYAKRRTAKKWTIEQKRKLVDARINYDNMFVSHPANSLVPWKKFLSLAKLDDFNVFFVRKQWGNMVAKYKQYKQNRLGNLPTKAIDNEMILRISLEWEFFEPIHRFMTRRTTNLHSYALKEPNTNIQPKENRREVPKQHHLHHKKHQNFPNRNGGAGRQNRKSKKSAAATSAKATTSSSERMNIFSSDTNEDYAAAMGIRNDHDFYSKRCTAAADKQTNYFADASDDSSTAMHSFDLSQFVDDNVYEDPTIFTRVFAFEEVTTGATAATTASPKYQQNHIKNEPIVEEQEIQQMETEIVDKDVYESEIQIQIKHEVLEADATEEDQGDIEEQIVPEAETVPASEMMSMLHQYEAAVDQCCSNIKAFKTENRTMKGQEPKQMQQQQKTQKMNKRKIGNLSERDKYYRHKRRHNHRLERRLDSFLNVFGQIVKIKYPSVDVSTLNNSKDETSSSISSDESDDDAEGHEALNNNLNSSDTEF